MNRVVLVRLWTVALVALGVCGCAHYKTVEERKQERYAAYAGLKDEWKAMVDRGEIAVGMPMDAVYIAWGKPSQVLTSETSEGHLITWLYQGVYLREYRYWTYREYYYPGGVYASPYLAFDYLPQSYVQAEVVFKDGVVKQWRKLPKPLPY